MALISSPIVIMLSSINNNKIVKFKANGVVVDIDWKSRNHEIPSFKISDGNKIKVFASHRITLNKENIRIGDKFVKQSGAKTCEINLKPLLCID